MQDGSPTRPLGARPLTDRQLPQAPHGVLPPVQQGRTASPSRNLPLPPVASPLPTAQPVIAPITTVEAPPAQVWTPMAILNAAAKKAAPARPVSRAPEDLNPALRPENTAQTVSAVPFNLPNSFSSSPRISIDSRPPPWQNPSLSTSIVENSSAITEDPEQMKRFWRGTKAVPAAVPSEAAPTATPSTAPILATETYARPTSVGLGPPVPAIQHSAPSHRHSASSTDGASLRQNFAASSPSSRKFVGENGSATFVDSNGDSRVSSGLSRSSLAVTGSAASEPSISVNSSPQGSRQPQSRSVSMGIIAQSKEPPSWSEMEREFSMLPVSRQSLQDLRASAIREISAVSAERDSWRLEAERLRKEIQNLKLQRLKDPSLLRCDMPALLLSAQANPATMQSLVRLQQAAKLFVRRSKWTRIIADFKLSELSLASRRRISIIKEAHLPASASLPTQLLSNL